MKATATGFNKCKHKCLYECVWVCVCYEYDMIWFGYIDKNMQFNKLILKKKQL